MTGQQLFDKYTYKDDEYAQTLFTARMVIADDDIFFKELEKAEKLGRKIALIENNPEIDSEPSVIHLV